jgi:hypothetical protein
MAKKKERDGKQDDQTLIAKVQEWFELSSSEDSEDRELALEDSRFCDEEDGQWQEDVKRKRKGLPNYTFNKVAGSVDAVVGDWKQNRARIKVIASEHDDTEAAEVRTGLIRQIENISDAPTAYDIAFECAVKSGFGAFRICTDYTSQDSFDQDILIKQIKNQFTVYWDPLAEEFNKSDGRYMIVVVDKDRKEFEDEYGDVADFSGQGIGNAQWVNENAVRIAECWYKKETEKVLLKLSDGSVQYEEDIKLILDELSAKGVTVKKSRKVIVDEIWCAKVGGNRLLENKKWAGSMFPIILVFGKSYVLDGKDRRRGIVRFAKDAQRSYNLQRSVAIERVALAPKAPYLVTQKMVEGHETQWANANLLPYPYLRFNPDPLAPGGRPTREPPADLPIANMQLAQMDADDIKATTGQYDASLGARSNETSGRAIAMRERQGDVATFTYQDNMVKALKYAGKVIVDLIPKIYDGERVVRILGKDGGEKYIKINEHVLDAQTGEYVTRNDMNYGKYDVVVETGPNYATQRVEAANSMIQFAQAIPQALPVIGDLLADAMDWPNKDQIADRLRATMPPNILSAGQKGDEKIPPQAKAAIAQMQQQMQQMQAFIDQGMQQFQAMQAENEQIKSGAAVKAAELQLKAKEIDLKEAELLLKSKETEAKIVESNAKATSLISEAETKEAAAAADIEKTMAEANQVKLENAQVFQMMIEPINAMAEMQRMQLQSMMAIMESLNKPKTAQVRLSDGRVITMEQK